MDVLSKNKIKWIRSLRLKKNRDAENVFVVEGAKMVQEIVTHWNELLVCIVTSDADTDWGAFGLQTDEQTMKQITLLNTPSSVLAVVKKPSLTPKTDGLILAIEDVQDPGNLGTMIRSADWFGVSQIVCSNNTVDCFNPKVIQASMGSLFRMPLVYTDLAEFFAQKKLPIYGALLNGTNLYETELTQESILCVGNEGNGISAELQKAITHPILIPGKGGAESLNVSVATGILLALFSK